MIKASEYQKMLEGNFELIKEQIKELSDSEMLIQPPNGGNCMLWTLGHLANNLLSILGFFRRREARGLGGLEPF